MNYRDHMTEEEEELYDAAYDVIRAYERRGRSISEEEDKSYMDAAQTYYYLQETAKERALSGRQVAARTSGEMVEVEVKHGRTKKYPAGTVFRRKSRPKELYFLISKRHDGGAAQLVGQNGVVWQFSPVSGQTNLERLEPIFIPEHE